MSEWVNTKILQYIGSQMSGWKTKVGGIGFILVGVLGLVRIAFPDLNQLPDADIGTALGEIAAGFAALGIGHKADKLTDAVKVQTAVALDSAQSAAKDSAAVVDAVGCATKQNN